MGLLGRYHMVVKIEQDKNHKISQWSAPILSVPVRIIIVDVYFVFLFL